LAVFAEHTWNLFSAPNG